MAGTQTTQLLMARVQQGSQSALNELLARYQQRVLAAVRIRLGAHLRKKVESWDIVQEVMIEAIRKLREYAFSSEGGFLRYINRVVENRIRDTVDHWTAHKRDAQREISLGGWRSSSTGNPLNIKDSVQPPSEVLAHLEDLERLECAMDRLAEESVEYRDLIVAVKIEGRSYQEIAQETGLTEDAVRMRTKRALLALTKIYRAIEEGNG